MLGGQVAQVAVNLLRQGVVFRRIGAVPVVKTNVEPIKELLAPRSDVGDKLLRCEAGFFRGNHDRCAMRVVGTHEVHGVALHALVADPNIGLDVLHHVPDVEVAIGIGQGGGDK